MRDALAGLPVVLLLATTAIASAQSIPDRPTDYVIDLAGVVDGTTRTMLNERLRELESRTGFQMLILTVNTLGGEPIESFSLAIAERWKLGQQGKDNGALIVVSTEDRKYRIETGYGAEGALPDAFCARVGRAKFIPNFKRGDYAAGLSSGVDALIARIATQAGVELSSIPRRPPENSSHASRQKPSRGAGAWMGIFVMLLLLSMIMGGSRRRRYRTWGGAWETLPWMILMNGGRSRSGGWGGGWSGGGGSFGGGGGGGFGGGGASGSW